MVIIMIVIKIILYILAGILAIGAFFEAIAWLIAMPYFIFLIFKFFYYIIPSIIFEAVAKCLIRITPKGKERITLNLLYTLVFGCLIFILIAIPLLLITSGFDRKVSRNKDRLLYNGYIIHNKDSFHGYTLVDDSTIINPYFGFSSIYPKKLVYDKTGEILTGDSSYYPIILESADDYMLANCINMHDQEGMVTSKAMLFQNGVKLCEKTFRDPPDKYRIITFEGSKFLYTYTGKNENHTNIFDRQKEHFHHLYYYHVLDKENNYSDKEYFHYDGSGLNEIESSLLSEKPNIYNISPYVIAIVIGYLIGCKRSRKTIHKYINDPVSPDANQTKQNQESQSKSIPSPPKDQGEQGTTKFISNRMKRKKRKR